MSITLLTRLMLLAQTRTFPSREKESGPAGIALLGPQLIGGTMAKKRKKSGPWSEARKKVWLESRFPKKFAELYPDEVMKPIEEAVKEAVESK